MIHKQPCEVGAFDTAVSGVGAARASRDTKQELPWNAKPPGKAGIFGWAPSASIASGVGKAIYEAQERERARIARDLHDQVGQTLTGIILEIESAVATGSLQKLRNIKQLAASALEDVRRIAVDLRVPDLDEIGLEAALKNLADELSRRSGLEVTLTVDERLRPSAEEATVLYRIVQESLTNVVRHAQATSASVVLTLHQGCLTLVVEDDGSGFEPDRLSSEQKVGLTGMRERLELLNGDLAIESRPGLGTAVYARLPTTSVASKAKRKVGEAPAAVAIFSEGEPRTSRDGLRVSW